MAPEAVTTFVDCWTVAWTAVLAVGYAAEISPWPWLTVLRSPSVSRLMLFSSVLAVFVLTLGGGGRPVAVLSAWAIVFSSLNWLFHYFQSIE